ncbi:hypothetical protein BGW80DRAFT_1344465 [Lactifluus volemus]|nr:hypothetical protein BGW80DRAFT_1344465 [Lactifluus volemus]
MGLFRSSENEFLLCYDEFGLYSYERYDRVGGYRRARRMAPSIHPDLRLALH